MADISGGGNKMPLRPAMVMPIRSSGLQDGESSPSCGPTKVVSIAETEPETISPIIQPLDDQPKKQYKAGLARRLSGRSAQVSKSSTSLASESSVDDIPAAVGQPTEQPAQKDHHHDKLLTEVSEWLQAERAKRAARKSKSQQGHGGSYDESGEIIPNRSRNGSDSSIMSLEKLQRILEDNMGSFGRELLPSASPGLGPRKSSYVPSPRRKTSSRSLMRNASSDTEYQEGDVIVPSCDVILDNSKTMSYTGGEATSDLNIAATGTRADKEKKAWSTFKSEILRLAHTLRLKGWRRVALENPDSIEVERLSGALTNAVYVVYPPKDLPVPTHEKGVPFQKRPSRLLLRIYGPQVEHLIDRESELGILRRLARKKIGPRLLGTFRNGRFEEYFISTTLTSPDLHVPETSKQIAKRMRELHEGIDLLERERDGGPFVWKNWDKWVERCEHVITFLDKQILSGTLGPAKNSAEKWKERGLVCGVEWPVFRAMIDNYRQFLIDHYGGVRSIRDKLVFAHNDTQYGNILRLKPSGESPLLLPANSHKQLVVIDFEYASANTPGLEFANHFSEWCYNYHDPVHPHSCNTDDYPTPEEQRRFIRSYVNHRPQFNPRASSTPKVSATASPALTSISSFMLDSRTPGGLASIGDGATYREEEEKRIQDAEKKVEALVAEARIWRIANSAQWVAWGIVQAKVPEMDAMDGISAKSPESSTSGDTVTMASDKLSNDVQAKKDSLEHDKRPGGIVAEGLLHGEDIKTARMEEEETHDEAEVEFDYLAYAQERAMFFWGDCVQLGLVKKEALPEMLRKNMKIVPY